VQLDLPLGRGYGSRLDSALDEIHERFGSAALWRARNALPNPHLELGSEIRQNGLPGISVRSQRSG
jgi:hypothetical protein